MEFGTCWCVVGEYACTVSQAYHTRCAIYHGTVTVRREIGTRERRGKATAVSADMCLSVPIYA